MNREEIMRIIPHRPPMLLVDEAEKKDENSCRGSYTVKGDEWFLQGHFPGKPTVAGRSAVRNDGPGVRRDPGG